MLDISNDIINTAQYHRYKNPSYSILNRNLQDAYTCGKRTRQSLMRRTIYIVVSLYIYQHRRILESLLGKSITPVASII